jgi:DNA-binding NtrC family response regulator
LIDGAWASHNPEMRILLVEDDRAVRITVRDALAEAGHEVLALDAAPSALAALRQEPFELILTDIRLPGGDGLALFREARHFQPECGCILMTAYGRIEDAVAAIREGAIDYITKPFEIDALLDRVSRSGEELSVKRALAQGGCPGERQLVGDSPAIARVRDRLAAAAQADVNVLVVGETGTGKELCARTLHCAGRRSAKPMIHVNCAAIPAELFEAEMFGHEKGAFTGAVRRREGRLLAADGGTLFLDEIGELRLEHQAKLLRALEDGGFEPVGRSESVHVDVRVISATNQDLGASVSEGRFRQDLYYRLNVIEVVMPPLRERRPDIPLLVSDFLREAANRRRCEVAELSGGAIAALIAYDYPGNVRELFHALEHALALSRGGRIELAHLPRAFQRPSLASATEAGAPLSLDDAVRNFERAYIERILERAGGRRSEAARLLGISRKSLWQKLKD